MEMPRSSYVNCGVLPIWVCPAALIATLANVLVTIGKRSPTRKFAASPSVARNVMCSRSFEIDEFMASVALIPGVETPTKPLPLPKKTKGASSGDPCRLLKSEEEMLKDQWCPSG